MSGISFSSISGSLEQDVMEPTLGLLQGFVFLAFRLMFFLQLCFEEGFLGCAALSYASPSTDCGIMDFWVYGWSYAGSVPLFMLLLAMVEPWFRPLSGGLIVVEGSSRALPCR